MEFQTSTSNCSTNFSRNCTLAYGGNETKEEGYDYSGKFQPYADILPIVLAVLIIAANTLILCLVYKRRTLRTVTNYILCSLAMSDLMVGLVGIPLFLACNIIRRVTICVVAELWLRFLSLSTASHLIMVTLDRYLAIIHSLRYGSLVTKQRGFVIISSIWVMSAFMSIVQLDWMHPNDLVGLSSESQIRKAVAFDIVCILVYVVFSFLFMLLTYSRILYEVVRQSKNIKKNSTPGWQETRLHNRREWKAVSMFAIMLGMYIICWLPYFLHRIQQLLGNEFFTLDHVTEYVFIQLRFLTSMINPCLYVFGKHDFRKTLGKSLGCNKQKTYIPSTCSDQTRSTLLKTSTM
ncbi:predicted protein [Nematostella vectensis]|uniref:G-protein coupled receptors family 1 profile domain-containing protein n=1 Tax=Nematostella vectensis TaxID=45351 RepID=A7RTV0_NEMVE|nr:octopamine receptor 1 [Nematostella vectensis]XP_032243111.1 octopamine receptor 1 [Nematostella vectensis]XP_032243112.1 octopamine receptor 1 [Nematostella vectensis]XP_032243113.1 octopamine receptor 1 [Nematostella vectensis]XP_032243114.1 octopamine receptor 1 [Nematostella vectensis]XP_032243115.1 octopamine receptor 1 [Nematostella vectensis]XP_032243116.1 octopamine receptor 1 [Nematostella vectensis]XP_032243117.1 octopamine receptor 1 [Nematostella vectensis]XP_032243118.1 octo|eukprot:XP_001637212.1 predicted protein [Nematostella vectensis]